jgi:hypothetical protein
LAGSLHSGAYPPALPRVCESRTLALFDQNGDKKISKLELKYGLEDYGLSLNLREVDDLMAYFDTDKSGLIDFDEFLVSFPSLVGVLQWSGLAMGHIS